ncbi:hypothetical protein Xoosp13_381 [Xanthomonas phage Xoo-sp13]|nr:hypothetical protein Xoosp13_381 [Xanthomonas phage Xoo-sp13]
MSNVYDGDRVFHAVIPRGSIYYRGSFGGDESIASNKLRVTHEVPGINPPGPNPQDEFFVVTYD